MVKVAIVGDIHLADKKYADDFSYEKRNHYVDQHEFVREQIQKINAEKPDHVLFLGDLIDWYSKENIDFALDTLKDLKVNWDMTPGNHDMQLPVSSWAKHNEGVVHEDADETDIVCRKKAIGGWAENGIKTESRKIDIGETSFYLLDSALCYTSQADQDWMMKVIDTNRNNIVVTHVPFPFVETQSQLSAHKKNLVGYFQSKFSDQFGKMVLSSVNQVFFGHVHFTSHYVEQTVQMHMIKNANVPIPDSTDNGICYLEIK